MTPSSPRTAAVPAALRRRATALAAGAALLLGAALLAGQAKATENYALRYSPGIGGTDMTAPLDPGWYGNVNLWVYEGKLKDGDGKTPRTTTVIGGPYSVSTERDSTTRVRALLPRLTFISSQQFLGATLGATVMLPLVERENVVDITNTFTPGLESATLGGIPGAAIIAGANATAAATSNNLSGKKFGIGDLELAPIMRWNHATGQVVFIPAVMLATGDYKRTRLYNPGAGNFTTFRPTVQFNHIGDGWDFGMRLVYSTNTRNSDTKYKSGDVVNLDFQLSKFVTESVRVGLNGYVLQQVTDDKCNTECQGVTLLGGVPGGEGNKGRVFGLGPAVGWIKDSGTLMVEGRVIKEFGAQNRPEGTAVWLTIGAPLGSL